MTDKQTNETTNQEAIDAAAEQAKAEASLAENKQAHEESIEEAQNAVNDDIEAMLNDAQTEAAKHKELALRLQADMENLRRRTRIDIEEAHKYALDKFVNALIPAMDSMEMGIEAAAKEEATKESIRDGVEMTFKQMLDVLGEFNVERLDPKGEKFDPQVHEAMTMIPSPEHESQTVVDVIQKGYKLNERLVRAARVIVAQ